MQRTISAAIVFAGLLLAGAAQAGPWQTNYSACFSPSTGWGAGGHPNIDGIIDANDVGWNQAYQYRYLEGLSNSADAELRAITDGANLYLGFQVTGDDTFDLADKILIMFDDGAGHYERVTINPLAQDTGADGSGAPQTATFERTSSLQADGSPNFAAGTSQSIPTWIKVSSGGLVRVPSSGGCSGVPGNGVWDVEMALPQSVLQLPSGTPIGMFTTVVRVDRCQTDPVSGNAMANLYTWPKEAHCNASSDCALGQTCANHLCSCNSNADCHADQTCNGAHACTPEFTYVKFPLNDLTHAPPLAQWGSAIIGSTSSCLGVVPSGLGTTNTPDDKLLIGAPGNLFHVTLSNHSVDSSGNPMAVPNVAARFMVSRFGAGDDWIDTAQAGLPTLDPGQTTTLTTTTPWTVQATDPIVTGNDHQCIRVDFDAGGNSAFVNRSLIRNTQWGTLSTFTDTPRVLIRSAPPAGMAAHYVVVKMEPHLSFAYAQGETKLSPGTAVSQANVRMSVDRFTGEYVLVDGKKYARFMTHGQFEYNLQHPMTAQQQQTFEARNAQVKKAMMAKPDGKVNRMAQLANVNALLANDADKPAASNFTFTLSGLKPVPNSAGYLFTGMVPQNQDTVIPFTAEYNEPICNRCMHTSTAASMGSGALVLLGLLAYGLRRRRR